MMHLNTFFLAEGTPMLDQFVGGLVVYIYLGYTVMVLARRLGAKDLWMAWVPIANLYLMTKMANQPWWWMFGFFIPYVQLFVAGFLWSEIGKRLGKEWWIGLLGVLPYIGILIPGYFVITTKDGPTHHQHGSEHHHPHTHG